MDYQDQLKLQSYLDGELSEADAREVARRLAQDQDATALLGELRQTRQALVGFETGVKLPESREFYWSKIAREIERVETPKPEPVRAISWLERLRRLLVPASGLALVLVVGVIALNNGVPSGGSHTPGAEIALQDASAFTYHDYSAGATLVWLSYPADDAADDDANGQFSD
jgi:anti-sigma factor RsiW